MSFNIPFKSGGGSISSFPSLPVPLSNDGRLSTQGEIIPHNGTLTDQLTVPYNSNTQPYTGHFEGTPLWNVQVTDINAACDQWIGVYSNWYDSINDRLYVFAADNAVAPRIIYTAYITLETGAVTNVGNIQLSTDPSNPTTRGNCVVSRGAIDSGNFTLYFTNRTIVINESTGAEVSNVASSNRSESLLVGNYATLDGSIFVNFNANFSNENNYMYMTKGGNTIWVPIPAVNLIGTNSSTQTAFLPWGDKIKVFDIDGNQAARLRTFLRSDFDAWLQDVAVYGGLS